MVFRLLQVIKDYLRFTPDLAHNPQQMCRYQKRQGWLRRKKEVRLETQ
jgi:hypothetical protein